MKWSYFNEVFIKSNRRKTVITSFCRLTTKRTNTLFIKTVRRNQILFFHFSLKGKIARFFFNLNLNSIHRRSHTRLGRKTAKYTAKCVSLKITSHETKTIGNEFRSPAVCMTADIRCRFVIFGMFLSFISECSSCIEF